MENYGLHNFIREIELYCYTTAIVTFVTMDGKELMLDLQRKGDKVKYGYQRHAKEQFMARLLQGGSLILRSFTEERDAESQLPIKELRGYVVTAQDQDLSFVRLLPDDLFWASNTDAITGEKLPPQRAVRYC